MPLTSLINQPATLHHRTGSVEYDRDGNEVPVFDEVETVVELQQRRRGENDEQIAETVWVAFFLPGETVGSGDLLVVDGVTYEVDGDPWRARNPRLRQASHVEATLQRKAGSGDVT